MGEVSKLDITDSYSLQILYSNNMILLIHLTHTPLKINMEYNQHNHGGLEDHCPFKMSDL